MAAQAAVRLCKEESQASICVRGASVADRGFEPRQGRLAFVWSPGPRPCGRLAPRARLAAWWRLGARDPRRPWARREVVLFLNN
jgi:hypothetical protein